MWPDSSLNPYARFELMTVIALLNAERDPHVVADTLLSAQGEDPRTNKTVWLPSLGQVSSTIGTEDAPSYIVRLARKTFFLPNHCGVLAFSGDCSAAFGFWRELCASILSLSGYQPDMRVDRGLIERAVSRSHGDRFCLLGLTRDAQGRWEVFTHNKHVVVETENFGTCYLAGSGSELLVAKLRQKDAIEEPIQACVRPRIGPTENLAESVSADLLYAESDTQTHLSDAATYSCGGFYEWYRVVDGGVRVPPARLDIHIAEVNGKPVISRIYLTESLRQKESQREPIPGTMYSVLVMSTILDATTPIELVDGTWMVPAPDPHAVLLQPAFELYSSQEPDGRLSGPVASEVLEEFFGKPAMVRRIRLVCAGNGRAAARSISRLREENEVLATLSYGSGRLQVSLSVHVAEAGKDMLRRLHQT